MGKKIEELRSQNKTMRGNSQEDEIGLRRQKVRRERDVEDVIKQYDSSIAEMVDENQMQQLEYKKELKNLQELKEHFAKVDAEKERIRQENAITMARNKKIEAEKQRRANQASLLQAFWRAILQREEFVKIKKANKKKGGGKKK